MTENSLCFVICLAFALDLIFGDPLWLPHPIRLMGNAIDYFEPKFRKLNINLILSGGLLSIFLIVTSYIVTFIIIKTAYGINNYFGFIVESVFIFYCISIKSLKVEALKVYDALSQSIELARKKVAMIVGRETEKLDSSGVARAAVETVAENLVDGGISPLFFAAIGGAPLAIAFKMVNTLDSMIGYKNEKYIEFGKIAARIDDVLNYIPARISVFVIAIARQIISRNGKEIIAMGFKEGKNHTSPNAGYSEAAFAYSLNVKLGGPNFYHGILVEKPYIGINLGEVKNGHIKKACDLMVFSALVWVLILILFTI